MERFQLFITPELRQCLDHVLASQTDPERKRKRGPHAKSIGGLIEALLRESPAIRKAGEELGIEWDERRTAGKPRKSPDA